VKKQHFLVVQKIHLIYNSIYSDKQGVEMGLESRVLDTVQKVLKKDNAAGFTNGCLFVVCDEAEARSIFHRLSRDFGVGKVLVNGPIQGEYAFDII
jgi:hypothetical protein